MPAVIGSRRLKTSMSMPSLSTAGAGVIGQYALGGEVGGGVDIKDPKRQRRLERNRESARLSRRRRKQYLEVLEEKVNVLSEQMDVGRRQHVINAISDVQRVRKSLIDEASLLDPNDVASVGKATQMIDGFTSPTCRELSLALQFHVQQMKSLVLPPQTRFILWLTLQNDSYYLGGRDSQQRLSAARIGEKLLLQGMSKASPADGMWPLLCNDTGLSYDQEEKVRAYQRSVLKDQKSWMDRHAVGAIFNTITSIYEVLKGLGAVVEEGVNEECGVLTMQQRVKLLKYCSDNKERLRKYFGNRSDSEKEFDKILETIHQYNNDSMKLAALGNVLNNVRATLPAIPDVVVGEKVKKLSRRPSFESLASATVKEGNNKGSSNNLVDMVNLEGDGMMEGGTRRGRKEAAQSITPEAAQGAFLGNLMHGGGGMMRGPSHQPGFVQVPGVGPVKRKGENRITPESSMWGAGLGVGVGGGAESINGLEGGLGGMGMNDPYGIEVQQEPPMNDITTGRQKVDSMEVLDMVLNDIDMIASMNPPSPGPTVGTGDRMSQGQLPVTVPGGGLPLQPPLHQQQQHFHQAPPPPQPPLQHAQVNMVGISIPMPVGAEEAGAGATEGDVDELMQTLAEDDFLFDLTAEDDWTIGGFADKSP